MHTFHSLCNMKSNTVLNTSLLCRINRRHQIISLKTQICRRGSKGLRSDCICICGLLWLSCDLWWWFIVNCDDGLLWLEVYCELWWWFIIPMTYNYACDDVLLWIVMVYCKLRGVRYTWHISKNGGLGRFAECNTRQRDELPECQGKTLGEETIFYHSVNLLCRVFWICRVYSNGHSAKFRHFAECHT